jgi:hypothetical protein
MGPSQRPVSICNNTKHTTTTTTTTKNTMPLEGFSHAISANKRPLAKALDRVASEMGLNLVIM